MPALNLTTEAVRKIKPADKQTEYSDKNASGLAIRVNVDGSKTWVVRYRSGGRDSKRYRMKIGTFPAMGLTDARKAARVQIGKAIAGHNPAENKARATAIKRARAHNIEWLINEFIDRYFAMKIRSPRTKTEYDRVLRKFCIPAWGNRPYAEITTDDILALTYSIAEQTPVQANRLHSYLSKMFRWARSTPMRDGKGRYLMSNPVGDAVKPADEVSRDRVLTPNEIRAVWYGCEKIDNSYGRLMQFMLLVGQRKSEISGMTADEINFQKGIWTIPARRNKAKRVHDIPLSKLALRMINQCIDEMEDGQRLIFSSERTGGEMSGWHKMKVRLDKASGCVHETDRDEDGKPLLLWGEKWTNHDLRRTLGTNMAELGVDRDVRERLLNHSAGTNTGDVHGTYNRFEYTKEKGEALELWAGKLTSILGLEPAENVVSLPTRAG